MLKRINPWALDPDTRLVHWFLVFTEAKRVHWWDRFLRPGFNHVYACRQDGPDWLMVNPRSAYTEIAREAGYAHNGRSSFTVGEADDQVTVVSVLAAVPKDQLRSRWFTGPVTCVEVIKGLLGIRAFRVFTPWQLYNYVRQCRGRILQAKDTETQRAGTGP